MRVLVAYWALIVFGASAGNVEGDGVPAFAMHVRRGTPALAVAEGRPPAGPDEVVLGGDVLERLGRDVGDTVQLAPPGRKGDPLTYRVVGVGLFPTFEDGHAEVLIVEAVLRSHERQAWVDVGAA